MKSSLQAGKVLANVFALAAVICWIAISTGCGDSDDGPPIAISAYQLCADYRANAIAADAKYKGKVLQVTGSIEDFGTDIFAKSFVLLTGDGIATAQCYFPDKSKLISLHKGSTVQIRGRCDGYVIISVDLEDCDLE